MKSRAFPPRLSSCLLFVATFLGLEVSCALAENATYQEIHELAARAAAPETRATALTEFDRKGTIAFQPLVEVYEREPTLRTTVAPLMLHIAMENRTASAAVVPTLKNLLKRNGTLMRLMAIQTLGDMGYAARPAVSNLAEVLTAPELCRPAANALAEIGESLQDNVALLSLPELKDAAMDLEAAAIAAANEIPQNADGYENVGRIRRSAQYLVLRYHVENETLWQKLTRLIESHPLWEKVVGLFVLWYFVLALLWLFSPLAILELHNRLLDYLEPHSLPNRLAEHSESHSLSDRLLTFIACIRFLLVPSSWICTHRVLDAWVKRHGDQVRESIYRETKREEQDVRIEVPVRCDGEKRTKLEVTDFQSAFTRNQVLILIHGEGGVGKTNLAYQFARWCNDHRPEQRLCRHHRMVPVLIRLPPLLPERDGNQSTAMPEQELIEMVRGQLRVLADLHHSLPSAVVKQLLFNRRILVIVDDLLELNTGPYAQIRPEHPDFPANAFLAASRSDSALNKAHKTTLEPLRLDGEYVALFVKEYVGWHGKNHLFTDKSLAAYCDHLNRISLHRTITVLFVKLYVDQVIDIQTQIQAGTINDHANRLPGNIPDLVLSYLTYLNRNYVGSMPDSDVYKAAKRIAWTCLDGKFIPSSIPRDRVMKDLGADTPQSVVAHLEKRLRLLRAERDTLRFSLDPLAEYLAGIWLVENNMDTGEKWKRLLSKMRRRIADGTDINGFLLALLDCCESKGDNWRVPRFVITELRALCNLDNPAS